MIRRIYILCVVAFLSVGTVWGVNFSNETLNYQIVYHWGLIWKHAASATMEIRDCGDTYDAKLCAKTLSWVDKIYKVRDTLYSTIDKNGFVPVKYIKATNEKNHVGRDSVEFSRTGNVTTGNCTRIRPDREDFKITLTTEGKAYDMLSVFYMLRTLDMDKLKADGNYQTTVFSGKRKERLVIKYVGEENIKLRDKSKHDAYHIKFTFTEEGKTKSSDDIDTWISKDDMRIPLMLKGSLPIGEIRVYYSKE